MDGGKKEGKVERFALCSGWRCVWGRCFCLRGLRGGGTGMVERLAIHRPFPSVRLYNPNQLHMLSRFICVCVCVFFLCVCVFSTDLAPGVSPCDVPAGGGGWSFVCLR